MQQLLDYAVTHPEACICVYASDMILHCHHDELYLTKLYACSCVTRHFYLGWPNHHHHGILLKGPINASCALSKHVAISATEAELNVLFHNMRIGKFIHPSLEELGHCQSHTTIISDKTMVTDIAANAIKKHCSCPMEMCCFWLIDKFYQKFIHVEWHPGVEKLADYYSKSHPSSSYTQFATTSIIILSYPHIFSKCYQHLFGEGKFSLHLCMSLTSSVKFVQPIIHNPNHDQTTM